MPAIRNILIASFIVLIFLLTSSVGFSEDFPGGESISDDEMQKGFAESKGILSEEKSDLESDKLKIGGQYRFELVDYQLNSAMNDASIDEYLQNPQSIWLYFDSRLKKDTRLFLKGRFIYDPAVDESKTSPFTGEALTKTNSNIEELKLQFHLNHKVFVTAGTQKIKWGTGQFWNPTDFLNSEKFDFLQTDDFRSGLGLLKVHVPYKEHNFYVVGNFENAAQNRSVGVAARGEVVFPVGELSATRYTRKNMAGMNGLDLSVGLGDFDFKLEGAKSDDDKQNSYVGGVSYQWQYNDEDNLIFSLEGVWNKQGVSSKSEYAALLAAQTWTPFQIAKTYQLASLYLPQPGSLNKSTFQLFVIRNGIDDSKYYRFAYIWTGMDDISFLTYLGLREGEEGTEMKLGGLSSDITLSATVSF